MLHSLPSFDAGAVLSMTQNKSTALTILNSLIYKMTCNSVLVELCFSKVEG